MSKIKMRIFGIDPGTEKAGWVVYDNTTQLVEAAGHDDWDVVREKLMAAVIDHCVAERVIIYSGTPGSQRLMPQMIEHIGRIIQICEQENIIFSQIPRIEVCEKITGQRPKRGQKISKSDIQKACQKQLNLEKPIRPLHASDALAVVLAVFPPK